MSQAPVCHVTFDSVANVWRCGACGREYETLAGSQRTRCVTTATPSGRAPADVRSDDQEAVASSSIGRVTRAPGADSANLELTPAEVRDLANRIVEAVAAAPNLEPTAQVWIAMLMLATAQLRHLGVSHVQVMQLVTVAWNGRETGIFFVGEDGPEGDASARG